jgi:hypothetical protein
MIQQAIGSLSGHHMTHSLSYTAINQGIVVYVHCLNNVQVYSAWCCNFLRCVDSACYYGTNLALAMLKFIKVFPDYGNENGYSLWFHVDEEQGGNLSAGRI